MENIVPSKNDFEQDDDDEVTVPPRQMKPQLDFNNPTYHLIRRKSGFVQFPKPGFEHLFDNDEEENTK